MSARNTRSGTTATQGSQRQSGNNYQQLQEALNSSQTRLLEAEDRIEALEASLQEALEENERMTEQGATAVTGQHTETDDSPTYSRSDASTVRAAGRRCCLLHMLWMDADCLFDTDVRNGFDAAISDLVALRSAAEAGEEVEDPVAAFWTTPRFKIADPIDVVREVISHLNTELAKRWFEPWFKREFKLGMRKMRSEAVNEVADQRFIVFKLSDDDFGERYGSKKRAPGAKALLQDDAYLTEPKRNENDPRCDDERFMRSGVLVRAAKLLLTSPSSVKSKTRSTQAGTSRAEKWHIKAITPSIISFMSTVVHFVLSGDPSFDRVTGTTNYLQMYSDNLELLRVHRRKHRLFYKDLIKLYNKRVLPNLYPDEQEEGPLAGMTAGRKAIMERLAMESDDDDESDGGEDGGD
ncbi:hypothetical protein FRC12_021957 [Ceratobasidium sp. 428]|nr:hypothetical protein FRC12_021957 [Ceratobasidium sp. 428]